jgi:hypothetical protein
MDRFTLPGVTFACSGPGAAAFIEANTITAFTYAAFGFILLLATVSFYFLRKKKGLLIVGFSVAVLAVHPAWTIGAMIGDCGMSISPAPRKSKLPSIRELIKKFIQQLLVVDFTIAFEDLNLDGAICEEFDFPMFPRHANQNHDGLTTTMLE